MHTSNNFSPNNKNSAQIIVCPICLHRNFSNDILCQKCKRVLPNTVVEVESQTFKTQKMADKRKISLTRSYKDAQIIFLSLAIGLGAVLFGGVTYYRSQKASIQQEIARIEADARTKAIITARNLEQYVGRHYLQVQEMAASPFLSDLKLWSAWSTERKKEYFQNNFIANSDGMDSYVVMDAKTGDTLFSGGTGTKTKNNKHLDYYQQVVEFEKPVIIPRRKSTKTGIAYMYMAAPSFDDQGKLLFVTRTRVRFDEIREEIAASLDNLNSIVGNSAQSSDFFLIDGIGRIIASENSEVLDKHIDQLLPTVNFLRNNKVSSVEIERRIDDSSYLIAYTPVVETRGLPELNWSLVTTSKAN